MVMSAAMRSAPTPKIMVMLSSKLVYHFSVGEGHMRDGAAESGRCFANHGYSGVN
jgi:hypothetical protein